MLIISGGTSDTPIVPPPLASLGADLTGWWDASNTSTITQAGGLVSEFRDLSQNAFHFRQSNDTRKPLGGTRTINGLHAIEFTFAPDSPSGKGMELDVAGWQPGANNSLVLCVVDNDGGNIGNNRDWFNVSASGSSRQFLRQFGGTDELLYAHGVGSGDLGPPWEQGVAALWGGYRDGATVAAGINGVYPSPSGNGADTGTVDRWRLGLPGSNSSADGALGEVVLVLTAAAGSDLTTARQIVEGYLAHKWGLEGELPDDHPFKDSAP